MLLSNQLLEMIKSNEEDFFDLKREFHDALDNKGLAELVKDIIAIANSAFERGFPEGYIIFGIDDKSKECFGIENQKLAYKKKEKDRSKNHVETQDELSAINQRNFVDIAKKYISGYKNALRVNYSDYEHAEFNNHIIGVLKITADDAPYTVANFIQKSDSNGKTLGIIVDKGQAWIRDGEDKRPMLPNEILTMHDKTKQKKLQFKREKKLGEKLGEIFSNWTVELLTLESGSVYPEITQALTSLKTKSELETHFCTYKSLDKQLIFLQEAEWYLNHMVVQGPVGNGKTTLINYLVNYRGDKQGFSTPILVTKFPHEPKLDDFLEYVNAIKTDNKLDQKVDHNDTRIIVIDFNKQNILDTIDFIKQILEQYKYFHIWVTCNETDSASLVNLLAGYKKQTSPHIISLDYLDKDQDVFLQLLLKYFSDKKIVQQIKKRKNFTFGDLVEFYNWWRLGKIPQPEIDPADAKNILFNSLGIYEKLLLKICAYVNFMDESTLNILVSVFELPFDTIQKMIQVDLFINIGIKQKPQLKPSGYINTDKLLINDLDIKLLVDLLNKVDNTAFGFLNSWKLSDLIGQFQSIGQNKELTQSIKRIKYRLQGSTYCQVCDEYYAKTMKACPSCGTKKKTISSNAGDSALFLPFPNKDRLSESTFNTTRGINPQQVQQIIATIPTYKYDV